MRKVIFILGTRPEAIKLAPIINLFKSHKEKYITKVLITAQHREMLDQVLNLFKIKPDFDLNIMTPNQSLGNLTAGIIKQVGKVLMSEKPDCVVVQGDTTTCFSSAISAFYQNIPIVHIEAGLRTNNLKSPFPEELNRLLTAQIADIHFAPTKSARDNLVKENIKESKIFIVGNSVIDALKQLSYIINKPRKKRELFNYFLKHHNIKITNDSKYILITGHRRESFGAGFQNICLAIKRLAEKNKQFSFIYPVHMNPNVVQPVTKFLKGMQNIYLIPPLDYPPFLFLLSNCYIVLSDSGGIQEEAPSLGKPILVMRENTERPEGVSAGTAKLVGTNPDTIVQSVEVLLTNHDKYIKMSEANNPYGDGKTSQRIYRIINTYLNK